MYEALCTEKDVKLISLNTSCHRSSDVFIAYLKTFLFYFPQAAGKAQHSYLNTRYLFWASDMGDQYAI